MPSVLQELLTSGLLECGDALYFDFRSARFQILVGKGGLLHSPTHRATPQSRYKPVLDQHAYFSSITAFCDAALHECAHEYVARFSAFRRVRHFKSNQTLHTLRERMKLVEPVACARPRASLRDENERLREHVAALQMQVQALQQLAHNCNGSDK